MKIYRLESDNAFIHAYGGVCIRGLEFNLQNPVNVSVLKFLPIIGENQEYDALEIFGNVISGQTLKKLAGLLCKGRLNVNREGLCYLGIDENRVCLGVSWYRLNDVFNWSEYGVNSSVRTTWNRCLIPSGKTIIDYVDEKKILEKAQIELKQNENDINNLKNQLSNCTQQSQEKEKALQDAIKKLSDAESELNYNKKQFLPKLLFVFCIAGVVASMSLSLFVRKKT